MTKIIALTGPAGVGKSHIAARIAGGYGFRQVKFAGALKSMLRQALLSAGCSARQTYRMLEGDLKETPSALLSGKSPRHAMQTLGTEWGRDQIGESFWTNIAIAAALHHLNQGAPGVVIDDCRFDNEAQYVIAAGGHVVEVQGQRRIEPVTAHVSESGVNPDLLWGTLHNGELLEMALADMFDNLGWRA